MGEKTFHSLQGEPGSGPLAAGLNFKPEAGKPGRGLCEPHVGRQVYSGGLMGPLSLSPYLGSQPRPARSAVSPDRALDITNGA